MECLYIPKMVQNDVRSGKIILLNSADFSHIKALRLSLGAELLVSNGSGLLAKSSITEISKQHCSIKLMQQDYPVLQANQIQFSLYISPLSDNSRTEFIIEKAVEFGVSQIQLLATQRSEFRKVRIERLQAKAIAALKQSKNAWLPSIILPVSIGEAMKTISQNDALILGDPTGIDGLNLLSKLKQFNNPIGTSLGIIVGPEGGLTEEEIHNLESLPNAIKAKVSNNRLRSETAAIALMSLIASIDGEEEASG